MSCAWLLVADVASAQSLQSLERDINTLREDVQLMQRKFYTEDAGSTAPQTTKEAMVKVGQMEETVRKIQGRLEEMEHKIKKVNDRIDLLNKDVDVRIKMIEGKPIEGNGAGAVMVQKFEAPVAVGAPKAIAGDAVQSSELQPVVGETKKATAQEIYQKGLEDLKANKYDEAEQSFSMILNEYPYDKLVGNAQYWLGETYYGKGDFERAAVSFANGYRNFPDSPKRPDSLLKLGLSMKALKKTDEACAAFQSLLKEFSKAALTLKDRAKKEVGVLKCK